MENFVTPINAPRSLAQPGHGTSGPQSFVLSPPDYVDSEDVSSTPVAHAVPSGASVVVFSATVDFYAKYNAAAAIPSGSITNGSASELNPVIRDVSKVTSIGLVAPSAGKVTMAFYFLGY